jgi:hypothetical protein
MKNYPGEFVSDATSKTCYDLVAHMFILMWILSDGPKDMEMENGPPFPSQC